MADESAVDKRWTETHGEHSKLKLFVDGKRVVLMTIHGHGDTITSVWYHEELPNKDLRQRVILPAEGCKRVSLNFKATGVRYVAVTTPAYQESGGEAFPAEILESPKDVIDQPKSVLKPKTNKLIKELKGETKAARSKVEKANTPVVLHTPGDFTPPAIGWDLLESDHADT